MQAALNAAWSGDELLLADGTYTGSGTAVLEMSKNITVRAMNAGQAILDGEGSRRVINIQGGTILLDGLNITRGLEVGVQVSACARFL